MFSVIQRPVLVLLALIVALVVSSRVEAARDTASAGSNLEIIVMEVSGCKYCPRFRQDILPAYSASPRAREVPMRFVDVNAIGADRLKLKAPIATVPTALLMRGNSEVGRIEGYVAPEDFSRLLTALLNR